MNLQAIVKIIQNNLSDDLRSKEYKGLRNKLAGHCYVASETLYHLLGGLDSGYKPMFIKHENNSHWFLLNKKTNKVLDLTAKQFKTKINYSKAIGKGFLTRSPSKRTLILLERIKNEISNIKK